MSRNFDLNTTAAKEANSGGKRITEPGIYVGTFRAAFYEKNPKGTESVNLLFVSESGQEAGPLALYTHNAAGEELPSYKTLNAILACQKLRAIRAVPGKVTLWDGERQAEVEKAKDTYPAMVGPRIGLVLTGEEYENRNGEIKTRLVIAAPFNPDTRQMADEVLGQSPATALDRYLGWLDSKARWVKPLQGSRRPAPAAGGYGAQPAADFDSDSIPF